jgi:transcription elongation GreA/GreB family factor
MNKVSLLETIIAEHQKDLDLLIRSAIEAREAATHSESKQEDKYDTRGLEASYLAGAQARRAAELESTISQLKSIKPSSFSNQSEIRSTAIIDLNTDGLAQTYFLIPAGGGLSVRQGQKTIKVITTSSPLGQELLGRKVGDFFEFNLGPNNTKEVKIINVI